MRRHDRVFRDYAQAVIPFGWRCEHLQFFPLSKYKNNPDAADHS